MGIFRPRDPLEDFGDLSTSDDGIDPKRQWCRGLKRWIKTMWLDILVLALVGIAGELVGHFVLDNIEIQLCLKN